MAESNETDSDRLVAQCCIAGGGPAGMMLGFLLARAGIDVIVLEKHADFLRDFRGDTIHPSTLEIMHELGLLDEFLKLPHQESSRAERSDRRHQTHLGRFHPLAYSLRLYRFYAAVGFSRLSRRPCAPLSNVPFVDASRGDRHC